MEPSLVQQTELMDLKDVYWGGGQAVHLVLIVLGVWLTLWDWNVCDLVSFTLPRSLFVSLCQTVKRLVGRFSVQIAEIQPKIIGGISSPLSLTVFCLLEFLIATDLFDALLSVSFQKGLLHLWSYKIIFSCHDFVYSGKNSVFCPGLLLVDSVCVCILGCMCLNL